MIAAEAGLLVCRFLFDAAALFLWGASTYLCALVSADVRIGIWRSLQPIRCAALGCLVIALIATLPLRAVILAENWADGLSAETLAAMIGETNIGTAWMLQVGATIVLAVAMTTLTSRHCIMATALCSAALLATLPVTGHAAMHDGWLGIAHRSNDIVHVIAAGAWIGALPAVLLTLPTLSNETTRPEAVAALMRFSTAGHVIVALAVVSGMLNVYLVIGSLPTDLASAYQRLLLVKIALVAAMIGIAVVNRYLIVPRISENAAALHWLARCTAAEIALGAGVIMLVAWFGMLEPQG